MTSPTRAGAREMSGLRPNTPSRLPKGYVDDDGTLHRTGIMGLACRRDEIEPLRDARVKENEAYATVIVLARVGHRARHRPPGHTKTIEDLFVGDFELPAGPVPDHATSRHQHPRCGGARGPFPRTAEGGLGHYARTSSGRSSPISPTTCTGTSTGSWSSTR